MPVGEELAKVLLGGQGFGRREGKADFVVPMRKIYMQYSSRVKLPKEVLLHDY